MAQYTQLNDLIAALRAASEPNSISPESHGYILKIIADILVTLVTSTDLQSTVASLESEINDVQTNHNQDYAHIQDLLDDKADLNGDKKENFQAYNLFIGKGEQQHGPILQLTKTKTRYGDEIRSDWLRLRNINSQNNTLYETYIPVPQVGSTPTQYIIATRAWVEDKIRNANLQPGTEVDLTGYYTSDEIDNLLGSYVTSEDLDAALENIDVSTDLSGYYTASQCDSTFLKIANAYNKTQIDNLLAAKQDTLEYDTEPTAASTNYVTSAGIKSALDDKQDKFKIVELTKVNDDYTSDVTFAQVKTWLENGSQVMYHYNNCYYCVSAYETNVIRAFAITGEIIKTIDHMATSIDVQSCRIGGLLEDLLDERYAMIHDTMFLLCSMGTTIDNIDNNSEIQIQYRPSEGDYFFNPSTGYIYKRANDSNVYMGSPSKFRLYANKACQKIFYWNGSEFIQFGS